jgi:transcriptional regulator with XRE-family HTH domain
MQEKLAKSLENKMKENGHTQQDIEQLTGVCQPLISRALNKNWKVLSPKIKALYLYCDLPISEKVDPSQSAKIMNAVRKVWDGSKRQEAFIARVIENIGALSKET